MTTPPDDLMARLRALPPPAEDPVARERTRRRAKAAYARAAASRLDRALAAAARWYGRLEPALALAVGALYLHWAVGTAARFLR